MINNAGVMPLSFFRNLKVNEWEQMIDVNIKGVLYGMAAVYKHMEERNEGHIINSVQLRHYDLSDMFGNKIHPYGK